MPEDDGDYVFPKKVDKGSFGEWLNGQMKEKNITISRLAELSGITYVGIKDIKEGTTRSPRDETRKRLAKALESRIPENVEENIEQEQAIIPGYEWVDFTPSDLETIPEDRGIYVFYDVTDRPVYVGKSNKSVRARVKDHSTRFWFKEPLVVRGSFLHAPDDELCNKIELILIKFLGKHALLNVKGAVRDFDE